MRPPGLAWIQLLVGLHVFCDALKDGLATTPPMSYNPWNAFRGNDFTESDAKTTMDLLVEQGFASVGYTHFSLDGTPSHLTLTFRTARKPQSGLLVEHNAAHAELAADAWSLKDRRDGALVPDAAKFGGGLPALASYAHKKGGTTWVEHLHWVVFSNRLIYKKLGLTLSLLLAAYCDITGCLRELMWERHRAAAWHLWRLGSLHLPQVSGQLWTGDAGRQPVRQLGCGCTEV